MLCRSSFTTMMSPCRLFNVGVYTQELCACGVCVGVCVCVCVHVSSLTILCQCAEYLCFFFINPFSLVVSTNATVSSS